jgi:autotransporter-associated beta strand protein
MKKLLFSLILIICLGATGWGQTTRYWKGSGTWTSANQWALTSGGTYNTTWVSNDIAFFDVAASTVTFASTGVTGITANENVTWTAAGTMTTNGTKIPIFVASGKTLNMAGQGISTAVGTGVIKNGSGVLISSNGNTYPGGFTLNAGTMAVGGVNAMGSGGALTINGGALTSSSSAARNLTGKYAGGIIINADFQFGDITNVPAGTGNLTFDNNVTLGNSVTRTITIANTGTYTFGGIISGTSSNLTVAASAAGILALTGANTYSGLTTISGGTVQFSRTGGTTIPITNNVTVSGGTLNIKTAQTLNDLTISSGTLTVDAGVTLTINGTLDISGGTITNSGTIAYGTNGALKYSGSSSQTSTNLEFPASNGPKSLSISNSAGFILHADRAINGTLTVLNNAIFDASTFVISGTGDFDVQAGATIKTAHTSGLNGNNTTSGGLSNYSTTANYTFNGSSAQVSGAYLPSTVNNLTIDNAAGVTLSNSALTVNGTMTINSGKLFNLEAGKQLTVATLTNNATAGLVLQSPANSGAPGSLIVSGSFSGSGTLKLERYVAAYTGATDGWHLLSSPVNNFTIAGSTFEPGSVDPNIDDLYWYDEATNFWKNYKVGGNFSSFTNGYGYLCSYQTAATKYFTGTPNNSDITFSDLTLTSTRGWHAIGNPFQSALKWNDGNWTLTNVNTTAKLLNSGGTYSNLVANDIIPAAQGVFVQVTDATNTITIPKAARTHNTASWNKSGNEILARLRFTADSETDNTYVETDFLFDSQASTTVDERNDGFFLQGIEAAPQMFLKIDNQNLSLKRLPSINGVYNLQFIKGLSSTYSFSMSGMESLPENIIVTLTDTKTNQSQVLTENPMYTFTSETTDSPDRFLVVFGVVGIGENNPDLSLQAYVHGNQLYVMNTNGNATLQLFDLQGRLIQSYLLNGIGMQSRPINLPSGVYVVKLNDNVSVKSVKVVIE